MDNDDIPSFSFETPPGYKWLIDRGLVGFAVNSSLQPWHYLPARHVFDLKTRWPSGPSSEDLVAFAKRQDSDELACFEIIEGRAGQVIEVHGWVDGSYHVDRTHHTFWDWLKSVVDDISEWASPS